MELNPILELISQYGALPVLAAVLTYLFIKNEFEKKKDGKGDHDSSMKTSFELINTSIRNVSDNVQDLRSDVQEVKRDVNSLTTEVEDITIDVKSLRREGTVLKSDIESLKKKKELTAQESELQEQIEIQIDHILEELKRSTRSARASLVRYHNGQVDMFGNSLLRMSCTNERTSKGVSQLKSQLRDQFRTILNPWFNEIKNNEICYVKSVDELKNKPESYTIYDFFVNRNVIAAFGRAVHLEDGVQAGFIMIEFMHVQPDMEVLDIKLKEASNAISVLLRFNNEVN